MEKFAVDLDKVLDDFELNEDEQESNTHYGKLEIEFRRENASTSAVQNGGSSSRQPLGCLGAVGGWSEAVHTISGESRVAPGLSEQEQNFSQVKEAVASDLGETAKDERSGTPYCIPEDLSHSSLNNQVRGPDLAGASCLDNPSLDLLDQNPDPTQKFDSGSEILWPHLPNRGNILKDVSSPGFPVPRENNSASSLSNPSLDEGVHSSPLKQPPVSCPLDVLPSDVPSNSGSTANHENQHPDILDVNQGSGDDGGNQLQEPPNLLYEGQPEERNDNPLPESEQLHSSPDIQREAFLLPDLMPINNGERVGLPLDFPHTSEASNPAIVTENSLSSLNLLSNEPAIVQESQSNSRIPEIANIHQSAELNLAHGEWYDNPACGAARDSSSIPTSEYLYNESRLSNSDCDNSNVEESLSEFHSADNVPCFNVLPDVSASCEVPAMPVEAEMSNSPKEEEMDVPVIRFNPCSNINEEELDAELQELEEEEARLQGACSGCQNFESGGASSQKIDGSSAPQNLDLIGGIGPSPLLEHPTEKKTEPDTMEEIEPLPPPKLPEMEQEQANSLTDTNTKGNLGMDNEETSPQDCLPAGCERSEIDENPIEAAAAVPEEDEELRKKAVGNEEVLSESTATDTLSSSSTLTDGDSMSPDHQVLETVPDQVPSPPSLPDSPSRETPGTLVTAVYNEREANGVGAVAPFWIPDEEAPKCQECGMKFTVLKRRHHCRGCGRVLCNSCCHYKAPLAYMDFKEARVCATCRLLLTEGAGRGEEQTDNRQPTRSPNPNNPMEFVSTIPPYQQVGAGSTGPPPTVMVPVGVLKREVSNSGNGSNSRPRCNKQVIFSDGIRPGGDLTAFGGQTRPSSPFRKQGRNTRRVIQNVPGNVVRGGLRGDASSDRGMGVNGGRLQPLRALPSDTCLIPPGGGLPPVITKTSPTGDYAFDSNPDNEKLEEQMKAEGEDPVVFALEKNLSVLVKQIKLDCCVGLEVWNVATRGLCNVGQEELVVLLEVNPGEKTPPPHLFSFLHTVYQQANKGNLVTELGHTIFTEPEGFLGSKDHGGFLYIRPTYQCLQKLILPPAPYIFAILIQKWETPWAKVFPLRLMLRLGAKFRYYPCPLVSTRNRKPVYSEIGHTIMNLLVDFRNYAYTIPVIQGFVIRMEDKVTSLLIPRNRYEQVWKALNNSNDHVLALGANFNPQSDSHLVTVEDDDGHYTTQAINIHNKPRKVTGASFIVFNGALKSTSGLKAKSSIVEDGLMVQISGETMASLREALRNMKDFDIPCGPTTSHPDEVVLLRWVQDDKNFNIGVKSPIDGRQMDGVPSVKIHSGTDYVSNDHLIRWTEVFIIQGETPSSNNDVNISRLAESLARACCMALTPHLALLYDAGPNRLALRATIHQDNVGYEAGMGGARLLPLCMKELDTELIPVIHRAASNITDQPIILELLFHIMEQ